MSDDQFYRPNRTSPPRQRRAAEHLSPGCYCASQPEKAAVERERRVSALGDDRVVDRDELRAVGKGALHLDLVDHLGDAIEHVIAPDVWRWPSPDRAVQQANPFLRTS